MYVMKNDQGSCSHMYIRPDVCRNVTLQQNLRPSSGEKHVLPEIAPSSKSTNGIRLFSIIALEPPFLLSLQCKPISIHPNSTRYTQCSIFNTERNGRSSAASYPTLSSSRVCQFVTAIESSLFIKREHPIGKTKPQHL